MWSAVKRKDFKEFLLRIRPLVTVRQNGHRSSGGIDLLVCVRTPVIEWDYPFAAVADYEQEFGISMNFLYGEIPF
jgi:hypothetical protein